MEYFLPASSEHIRKEREKARELRKSQWWKNQLGRGVCYYCEGKFITSELTMDHVIPVIRGGKSSRFNVVTSCKKCNSDKKYSTPAELAMQNLNLNNCKES